MNKPNEELEQKREKTATLNDRLRTQGEGGMIVITNGVDALETETKRKLFDAIRDFDTFTPENDPYGERDFGAIKIDAETYFWKIDYYDASLEYGSPDSSDPSVTKRVMTILRADEY